MINQRIYTDEVLFNNYMVSSPDEEFVHSQIPHYLNKAIYDKMSFNATEINKLALRVLNELHEKHLELIDLIDDFPLKDTILNMSCSIAPMFWTRFDTFIDNNDNVLFAELNYDKPCAQKEIALAGKAKIKNNVNTEFQNNFIKELTDISLNAFPNNTQINIGVMLDPCHYEELHCSYYFKDLFKNTNINILPVGPSNFSVKDNIVYAFDSIKLDILLKLFPAEYLTEISYMEEILHSFNIGNVLILNDPRIVAIQAKSFLAYLWKLVTNDSPLLSEADKTLIRSSIPYTRIFTKDIMNIPLENKDKYVLKASLGRYSGEVYIGKLMTSKDWNDIVTSVLDSDKIYVLQETIDIRKEALYAPGEFNTNIPVVAYGNYGPYLIKDKLAGICVRWSESYLTVDTETWMSPIAIKDYPISVLKPTIENRKSLWTDINDNSAFKYEFTGGYWNTEEYFSLSSLILDSYLYKELCSISKTFCNILEKTSTLVKSNFDMFSKLLGIPESLKELVLTSYCNEFSALGRIDFTLDINGNIKILEFNSETPAGLVESIGLSKEIKNTLNIKYLDPNENLSKNIVSTFKRILDNFPKPIKNIGFLSTSYYEDLFNTSIVKSICKDIHGYNFYTGNIYDLEVIDNKLYLYGEPLDAIYRYFPLDWFDEDELKPCIPALNKGTYVINPTHTLITQSKALFAVIYELIDTGYFTKTEELFIKNHIPYTSLDWDSTLSSDFIIKPYLSREGEGIEFSHNISNLNNSHVIFQDRINLLSLNIEKHSISSMDYKPQFPIIGGYICGKELSGIFTRFGDYITDTNATFLPTYIK